MQDLSSTVSFSPSFSFYVSGDGNLIATAVRVANESLTVEDYSVKVNGDDNEDFEFETLMPLEDESNVDDDVASNRNISKNLFYGRWNMPYPPSSSQSNSSSETDELESVSESSNYCFWSPLRSPAREGSSKSKSTASFPGESKRCRFKELLRRSHSDGSDGVVSSPSASKRCRFKDLLRRSHSDGSSGGDGSQVVKGKAKTVSYKSTLNIGEVDKRRKSYLPYRQDLIGVFAGMSRLRH